MSSYSYCLSKSFPPMLQEIRSAHCFSIIADETRDASGVEQFSISIRWVNGATFEIHEDCIGFVAVENTDSLTLASTIKDVLLRCQLDMTRLVGQAYDGARNMSGRLNGVIAIIKAEYP